MSKWPQTTQNRQVHAKQKVGQPGQLYFIIHNSIIYFEKRWVDSHTKSYKAPDPAVPIESL